MIQIQNYIDGDWCPAASAGTLEVLEPATGQALALAPDSGAEDAEAAVAAARKAFPAWSAWSAAQRSELLLRIAAGIEAHFDALAEAESADTGKPLALARRMDIPRAVENFRFFAHLITGFHSEAYPGGDLLNYTLRQPAGVAALISPWNLPLYLLSWKIAPALAAGCTAVAKPSEITPLTAFLLSRICAEAGLPPGVLNLLFGTGPRCGEALSRHPGVAALSFTGSTATGRRISEAAGPRFAKLALEMGGKNATLIFADADYEEALATSLRAAFTNQGQICLCGSRILVEASLYERFTADFTARTQALRTGDPLDPASELGALVSQAHLDKCLRYLALAEEEGGEILCGGRRPEGLSERCQGGYFLSPAVLAGLGPGCRVNQEEIFGPVVSIQPFRDEAEALALANGTPYGLAASLWTRRLDRAHRMAARLEAGIVWVNCWLQRDLRTPFGGMKQSGLGREGGEEALRFFTEAKNVCVKWEGEIV
jgi:aminomuconate-semialdehyde/2-hydroxymuconate-6-semialdehyde dehydrogenase